ncbi:MAG: ABC transporter substrate-binding protein [Actinomycetota bacterium]|jgi:branched-chain amino acid transport system substrate-binding protein
MTRRTGRVAQGALALALAATLTAACGTRVERQAASNPAPAADTGGPAAGVAGEGLVDPGAAPAGDAAAVKGVAPEPSGSTATAGGTAASGSAPRGSTGPARSTGSNAPAATGGGKAAAQPSSPGGAAPGPDRKSPVTTAPAAGVPGGGQVVPPGDSPVLIASIGILSGPAGGALAPNVTGLQMWVKWINAKGGLNGHPVKLFVYDDGGDPAKHRAQVQDAIEQKKVIAFVMNNEAIAGKGSVDYITEKRVPVIGNEGASYWFYDSPMYFVQASTGDANFHAAIGAGAQMLLPKAKKYGSIVCVEADGCNAAARVTTQSAKDLGFEVVYTARASIAQPDYTAECLAARNAGVQTLLVFLDPAGISRVGTACARQGFKPNFLTANSLVVDAQKDDPNLAGIVASTPVFPWFQTGTPATDEYQQAVKQFGQGLRPGVGGPTGWTSAKVFGKAAANMTEPPTSEAVLKGLWTFRNEDLGGITQPLTFIEGKNATPVSCWFTIVVNDGAWTSPDNFQRHCKG